MNDKEISTLPDLETQEISPTSEKAPDGGYGWIVTTSVAIVNGHSWGINAAYSVFLAHSVKENTFPGTTPLIYAIAGSLSWFTRRRALANGIAIAGAGLGGLTYSLATGAIIRNMGLEWAYRILAIVSAVANITCTLLIQTRYNSQATRLAFDTTLLYRPEYLLVLSYGAFSMLGYFVLIFTLANYANVIGLSSSQASMIPAFFMFGQAIGRPCIGWLSDRFGRINLTFIMSFITGILTFAIWINAKSFGVLLTFALAGGLSAGVFWVNISPVLVEVMGLENLASALSCLWVTMAAPSTFSAPIALEIYTGTGSYLGAQLFTGFMYIAASFCVLGVRRWKVRSLGAEKASYNTSAPREDGQDLEPMSCHLKCLKLDIV
ncbi:monocarboxylate transporter [Fusarium denticulatum]|uniref:Monocarboxylate transporter n=1 Tax=Fusarium denticulatum TaxID=48507 RepID=A0A8H5XEH0_9HYPO|nr:monocarboxylate transporter [Fusarium denticulatum]